MCFTYYFAVFRTDVYTLIAYDRHTLLEIGSSVAHRKSDFEFLNVGALFTNTAAETFVWATRTRRRKRRRKRGKRAGVLIRLRCRAFLRDVTLSQPFCWLRFNKLCELQARISYQRETRDCCVICLTEAWMSAIIPDSAIKLTGFSVHRTERKSSQGKSEVGASFSISTTCGVMKGTYNLLNPSAPLIWNFIYFCFDHSDYRENLQRS